MSDMSLKIMQGYKLKHITPLERPKNMCKTIPPRRTLQGITKGLPTSQPHHRQNISAIFTDKGIRLYYQLHGFYRFYLPVNILLVPLV